MANTGTGFGLTTFGRVDGASPTAGQTPYTMRSSYATAVFTGDLCSYSTADQGFVVKSTGTDRSGVVGVFLGCQYYSPTVGRVVWNNYFPGSVNTSSGTADATVYLCDDGDQLFLVRTSTEGTAVGSSYVGWNIGISSSMSGTTATGRSLAVAFSSTITANASAPFRVVDLYSNHAPPGAEGIDDTAVGNIIVVAPNSFGRRSLTATST